MYIFKNAWKNIIRNKSRNFLIGIIVIVIATSCSVTLAIRESANDIVVSYQDKNKIEATIGMNREYLMKSFKEGDKSQEEIIESFNDIEDISIDEINLYGDSEYVSSYYYTYSLSVDAKDIKEATDSLVKETTEVKTETSITQFGNSGGKMPPGRGQGGTRTEKSTTTKKTEKIFNEKAENGAFTLVGYDSFSSMSNFISGEYTITEGNVSSDFSSNSCVISEELATLNDLKVDDTITVINPDDTSLKYDLVITGIYKENSEESSDMSNMYTMSANQIITNINFINKIISDDKDMKATINPTFIIKDSDSVSLFTDEVTEKGLGEYYIVTSNLNEIEGATKSIMNVKIFATTFLIIMLIIGAVVLVVINMINIRERKYEIGVLRTIGMKKSKLSLQFMLELFIVSFVSLMLGAVIGSNISLPVSNRLLSNEIENASSKYDNIGNNFGIREDEGDNAPGRKEEFRKNDFGIAAVSEFDSIDAVVDFKVLLELLGIGLGLTIFSSLISMIAIFRFSPLTILKERS